jgi:8-oxo-dGTP pyrophosphatase MutT (NUDIX family)
LVDEVRLFTATKALIVHEGKVLVLRESSKYVEGTNSGRFDVVGGRITPGERFEDALKREIFEETGLSVKIGKPFFVNESWPVVKGEKWQVVRIFFEAFSEDNKVILSEDHDKYEWINPNNFRNYPIIENLVPVFEAYINGV